MCAPDSAAQVAIRRLSHERIRTWLSWLPEKSEQRWNERKVPVAAASDRKVGIEFYYAKNGTKTSVQGDDIALSVALLKQT